MINETLFNYLQVSSLIIKTLNNMFENDTDRDVTLTVLFNFFSVDFKRSVVPFIAFVGQSLIKLESPSLRLCPVSLLQRSNAMKRKESLSSIGVYVHGVKERLVLNIFHCAKIHQSLSWLASVVQRNS